MKTLDDWPRVKRVLAGALACDDVDRAAYLEHACGPDQALRAQVETLLAARERASTFLETPAVLLLEESRSREDLSGRSVGPYRLASRVGAGGSGEVYLARDTRLDRDVALKVLPETLAADAERIGRFRREAQLLASLNHPNIAAIYGFEEGGAIHALVLELVEGPTLADRIAQGPLPLDEALPIARQIVEAVEAAHARGIIHRDLKPANIKLRPDGTVKVLDFGLAKALESGPRSTSSGPTPQATTIGLILGTPSYMSPEQARGKVADKRADVWAFGCLLYEMLSGRRPFAGDNTAEVLAQILTHEPDFNLLPATTPAAIRRLLRRCLEKDISRRLPDIGVARIEIDDAIAAPHVVAEPTSRVPARYALPWIGAALLLIAAVGGTLAYLRSSSIQPNPPVRASIALAEPLDLGVQQVAFALSPDGSRIVYRTSADGPLRSRLLSEASSAVIPGTEGALIPFFSPDGKWLAFFVGNALKKVAFDGGAVATIARLPISAGAQAFRGASWGDDGTIAFASSTVAGLFGVADRGGEARPLTTLDPKANEAAHRWPHFLPGGKAILYTVKATNLQSFDDAPIIVRSLETGEHRAVAQGASAHYLPTGHLVYARRGALYAVRFDATRLAVSGRPVKVADTIITHPETGAAQVAISQTGTLVYAAGGSRTAERQLLWVDRSGAPRAASERTASFWRPRISPDGKRVAVTIDAPFSKLWVLDAERGTFTRASDVPGDQDRATWMPDGSHMTFAADSTYSGAIRLYSERIGATGGAALLFESARLPAPLSWSPDGRSLLYGEFAAATGEDVWVFSAADRKSTPLLQSPAHEFSARFSPDGRWVAYASDQSGRAEVYVRPFRGAGTRHQVSLDGGIDPVWSADGRELFFTNGNTLYAAPVTLGEEFVSGAAQRLFSGPYAFGETPMNYDAAPDGQHFVVPRTRTEPAPRQLELVLNWFEEVKRLAP
jgi:eukaryotic-like serine/threonine-protein kinase